MGQELSRRDALKRAAAVGGALAWSVPVVQAMSLTAAHAESPSAPPGPPGGSVPGGGTTVEIPPSTKPPTAPAPSTPTTSPAGAATTSPSGGAAPLPSGSLSFTGTSVPAVTAAVVGAGLVASGAAATVLGRRRAAAATGSDGAESAAEVDTVDG